MPGAPVGRTGCRKTGPASSSLTITQSTRLKSLSRPGRAVMVNDEEAVQFSGQRFLPAAAHVILSYGPRGVIIKSGENGSLLFTRDRGFLAPAHPLEAGRDPPRARDAFARALLGAAAPARDGGG